VASGSIGVGIIDSQLPGSALLAGLAGFLVLTGLAAGAWWRFRARLRAILNRAGGTQPPLGLTAALEQTVDGLAAARERAEKAQRCGERRLRDIAEAASIWIWESDAEHRLTYVSPLPTRTIDLPARQILGQRFSDLAEQPIAEAEGWRRHFADLAAHRPYSDFQFSLRRADGTLLLLRCCGKPVFQETGQFVGYVGTAVDVTAQVAADQRAIEARRLMMDALREARDAAERANRGKSRFLAAASHDLRQPLQALGLFLATLQQRDLPDKTKALLDKMDEALEALEQQFASLLEISRLDAGLVEAHLARFEASRLFERLESEFRGMAERKGLSLRFCPSSVTLTSDATLLERILRGLLTNALTYTRHGGVLVACRRRGGLLRLEVWDSGPGIPATEQKDIFDEFHRPNADKRRLGPGLGLGLNIVDRLAKLLGHRIEVKSRLGRGSVFSVIIAPPQQEPWRPQAPAALPATARRGMSILVIDDDPIIRDGLYSLLDIWGYRVVAVGSVEEGRKLIEDGLTCDLLIIDYRLHGEQRNGLDAIHILRHLAGNADLPAILITGDTGADRQIEATAKGLTVMHKPVRPDQLRSALQRLSATAEQPAD
jgi:PAS domain S-box-containing protein